MSDLSKQIEQRLTENEAYINDLCSKYLKLDQNWLVTEAEDYYSQKLAGKTILGAYQQRSDAMDFIRMYQQPCMLISTEDGWRKYYYARY